jgi:hypothetical protein
MPYVISGDPRSIRDAVESEIEGAIKFVILRTHSILTGPPQDGGTPVKTGFASASWICSVGAPYAGVAGSKEDVDYGPQEAGVEGVHGFRLNQGAVFLVNNTEYIVALNYGHSKQARPGFVESAFERAQNEANQRKL